MAKDFTDDLENWMKLLPYEIRTIPIINLAVPGSHDSMSYGIKRSASVAPDAESIINGLCKVMPCVVRRWSKTQYLKATEQLMHGIRYFDLRICLKKSDRRFYFVHNLFCEDISGPLDEIKEFLDDHPLEMVILDCQHFFEFSIEHYGLLANELMATFGDRVYGRSDGPLTVLTMDRARQLQKQVVIIYRNTVLIPPTFWPSESWPTPWPNQINANKLQSYLDWSLGQRSKDTGYVTQCVLTPPVHFFVSRFYSTLRQTCADQVCKKVFDWIRQQRPGIFQTGESPTSNVFIADFIDMNDFEFCKIVVALNSKILQSSVETNDIVKDIVDILI